MNIIKTFTYTQYSKKKVQEYGNHYKENKHLISSEKSCLGNFQVILCRFQNEYIKRWITWFKIGNRFSAKSKIHIADNKYNQGCYIQRFS